MTEKQIIEALEWRYATKKFNPEKKVSKDLVQTVLKAASLTATSLGIQPYQIMVVRDGLERLKSATFNQENIQTCSHLLVICHRTDVDDNYVSDYVRYMEEVRDQEAFSLEKYAASSKSFVSSLGDNRKNAWLAHQAYIVMGNLLTVCALLKIDSCPMEGFNAKLVDEILELESQQLRSVLILPIGYRADDDKYARLAKVRKPLSETVKEV